MFNNSKNILISGGNFSVTSMGIVRNCEHRLIVRRYPMESFSASGLEILKDGIATGAFHNSSERYDPPKCYPRTRLAVLTFVMDWIKNDQKKSLILWLYGPAGAGKSAIAQTIAEMCERLGILVASFFWSRTGPTRNDATRLIASLAYQLLVAIPQMRNHVETVIENDPLLLSRSLMAQMESLIIDPLSKAFSDSQEQIVDAGKVRVIILDGLDECGNPKIQAYILEVISTAIQKFPIHIHFLIACRPEQEIRNSFNSQPLLSITERLALDDRYHPDNDIRTFFTNSFNSLKKSHVLGCLLPAYWPTHEDIEALVRKSSGQFIYASTVLNFMKSPRHRPDERLNIILRVHRPERHTPFAELDTLYVRVFSMVEDFPRVLDILGCLFFLQSERMNVCDIENLLFYNHGDIQLILSDLHSILDVPDVTVKGPIRVFHASLQDFLLDQSRSGPFYLDEGIARARLTQICMSHIPNIPPQTKTKSGTNVIRRMNHFVVEGFRTNFLKASPTIDLLRESLNFNFERWVSASYYPHHDRFSTVKAAYSCFQEIILLSTWLHLQRQESIVKKPLTESEMNLYAQRSHTRDMAIDRLLRDVLGRQYSSTKICRHKMAAITHPLLLNGENRSVMFNLLSFVIRVIDENPQFFPVWFDFYNDSRDIHPDCIFELQQFLRNRSRAGRYHVSSEMYSCLSLRIWKFIIHHSDMPSDDNYGVRILQLAIETLPFYLMNGNYESEMAVSFLGSEVLLKRLESRYQHVEALQEAISFYLSVESQEENIVVREG